LLLYTPSKNAAAAAQSGGVLPPDAHMLLSPCDAAGPADMGFSFGLHVQQDYDLPAMMASPDMQQIYGTVVEVRPAAAVQQVSASVHCSLCMC
jgi:hypothetical protein